MKKNKILILGNNDHGHNNIEEIKNHYNDYVLDGISHPYMANCDFDVVEDEAVYLKDLGINPNFKIENYDGVILPLKLKLKSFQSKLNGIEIIKLIRTARFNKPIFLIVDIELSKLNNYEPQIIGILKTPGIYIVDANRNINISSNEQPHILSEWLLDDILYYANSRIGFIEELIHQMKNDLYELDKVADNAKKANHYIKSMLPHFQCYIKSKSDELRAIFNEITSKIEEGKLRPSDVFYQRKIDILALFDSHELELDKINKPWGVLYIEDSTAIQKEVKSYFEQRGLVCFTASNSDEAINILSKDFEGNLKDKNGKTLPSNYITVLISDYRLEDENGFWDNLQGYDLIHYAHKESHNMLSYMMLTSKKGAISNYVKDRKNIKILWYAKDDVFDSDSSFEIFFQSVIDEGDNTFNALCSVLKTSSWHKASTNIAAPLKDYYKAYRNLEAYDEIEKDINRDVLAFLEEVDYEIGRTGKNEWVKAPEIEIDLNEIRFNTEFKSKIDSKPSGELDVNMQKFITKLKGRRIALALSTENYMFSSEHIINLLKFGKTDPEDEDYIVLLTDEKRCEVEDEGKEINKTEKQLLPTHLNLSKKISKDIPFHILPEEINFLEQELGICISNKDEREKWYLINKEIERECKEIYLSDPDKYAGDKFLEKPKKVFNQKDLDNIKRVLKEEYDYTLKLNGNKIQ